MWVLHDETQIYLICEEGTIHFNALFEGIRIADVGPGSPEPVYQFEQFSGSNGSRLVNFAYDSFPFFLVFRLSSRNLYDWRLVVNEMRSLFYREDPYYICYSGEPGKRFRVVPEPWEVQKIMPQKGMFALSFTVFPGISESIASTQSNFNLEEDWQFSQGLVAEEYQYTHETSRFIIFNGGDFTIDPREHDLTIRIEGESDGEFILFNRTTGDRFIYYPPLHRRYGESLVLESVYPRKNGVSCGIDTNHGVITLAPGENHIELQNISRVKSEWDFRFLYK
ncbi:phage tail domain-containing protein [Enterococcus mundtii]|uniref:phage tail domain-containing protein n=1 Tax=Enterococcus mundtii TaxID=53346 RepID=UPI00210EEA94|nr:phage tail domain-containing protein [Enterococcus mundtii]